MSNPGEFHRAASPRRTSGPVRPRQFLGGETFTDLPAAQAAATTWCTKVAGTRMHGTLAARPLEVFTALEAAALLPVPSVCDVPVLRRMKVHRDHHVEIAKAVYSLPTAWIGATFDARAYSQLVELFHRGRLVKTHPRQPPGGRSTDPDDLPRERTGYAIRDLDRLRDTADAHGENIGIYVHRLLADPLPWTRMRAVLLGLVRWRGQSRLVTGCPRGQERRTVLKGSTWPPPWTPISSQSCWLIALS